MAWAAAGPARHGADKGLKRRHLSQFMVAPGVHFGSSGLEDPVFELAGDTQDGMRVVFGHSTEEITSVSVAAGGTPACVPLAAASVH